MQAIPREYYEAAEIDGASGWQSFLHITLPLLMPVLAVTTVLNLLYGLKVFDIVFVLTNGGPGRATDTVYTAIFDEFSKGRYGVATALSSLLFVVMIGLAYFVIRLMHREEERCNACMAHEQISLRSEFTNNLLAVVVSLIMIIPVYLVFVNALKTRVQASSMGVDLPTDDAVAELCDGDRKGQVVDAFGNSMLYAVVATLIGITSVGDGRLCAFAQSDAVQSGNLFVHHHGHRNADQLCDADQGDAADPADQHAVGHHPALFRRTIPLNVFLIYAFIADSAPRARRGGDH